MQLKTSLKLNTSYSSVFDTGDGDPEIQWGRVKKTWSASLMKL